MWIVHPPYLQTQTLISQIQRHLYYAIFYKGSGHPWSLVFTGWGRCWKFWNWSPADIKGLLEQSFPLETLGTDWWPKKVLSNSREKYWVPDPGLVFLKFYFDHFWLQHVTYSISVPQPGWNLCPLQWKYGVLTTGPPGKSPRYSFCF